MPTNKGKKKANSEAALALGGRPKRGVMAVTTTTTLRRSVRGVAPTAPAAAVTVPGGAAPAVAAAATDRTSSWCNTIAGSRPSINTGHNLNIHDAATLPVPATILDDKCSSFSSEDNSSVYFIPTKKTTSKNKGESNPIQGPTVGALKNDSQSSPTRIAAATSLVNLTVGCLETEGENGDNVLPAIDKGKCAQ